MDFLTNIILGLIEDQQTAEQLSVLFIAIAVFCVILGIALLVNNYFDPVRSRFIQGKGDPLLMLDGRDETGNIYQKYSHTFMPSDQQLVGRTVQRLHYAGYHFRRHLYQYYALRFVLMILLPTLSLLVIFMMPGIQSDRYIQVTVIAAVMGYIGPSFILDRLLANRQKLIQRAFPDALDLLVVCTEAGLSLDAAIQKVASEIGLSQPVLAEEINMVIAELRAGVERKKALSGLADRTGLEDIRGLMSSINQSMRFGSSIAETLRVYSEDFRDKRQQAAEEKAAKIGVKLIFPTAFCLLPCFILIILVPFGMKLAKSFQSF